MDNKDELNFLQLQVSADNYWFELPYDNKEMD